MTINNYGNALTNMKEQKIIYKARSAKMRPGLHLSVIFQLHECPVVRGNFVRIIAVRTVLVFRGVKT